jgi:hypothetical protein
MIQQVGPGPSNSGPLLNSITVGLGSGGRKGKMKIKAYVYDEETMECLAVIGGVREDVEAEIAARFEQHGTPATFHPGGLVGVGSAEFIEVTA